MASNRELAEYLQTGGVPRGQVLGWDTPRGLAMAQYLQSQQGYAPVQGVVGGLASVGSDIMRALTARRLMDKAENEQIEQRTSPLVNNSPLANYLMGRDLQPVSQGTPGGSPPSAPAQGTQMPTGDGRVSIENLPPMQGMSAPRSGPPLSMPVVGQQGIAKQGGSIYMPTFGSEDGPIPKEPGSFFRPASQEDQERYARERAAHNAGIQRRTDAALNDPNSRWSQLLGNLEKSGEVPPDAVQLARYLGPDRGLEILQGAARPTRAPSFDSVNLLDSETGKTAGYTKARAASLLETNPGRYSVAGTVSNGGGEGTETEREVRRLIESDGLNESDARDLAYGRARIVADPVSGQSYKYNLRTGQSTPLQLERGGGNPPSPERASPPTGVREPAGSSSAGSAPQASAPQGVPTLWEDATATGVVPALQAGASAISGQMGGPVASNVIASRQRLVNESQGLVRSLANNPRFPVGEMEALKKEISIQPDVFDSAGSMRARMVAIDQSLGRRYEDEVAAAENPSLPVETRQAAKQAANDIRNFRVKLGVPRNAPGNGGVRGGSPGVDASGAPIVPGGSVGSLIGQMSKEQISKLDPKQLSKEELAAAARRYEELGGE